MSGCTIMLSCTISLLNARARGCTASMEHCQVVLSSCMAVPSILITWTFEETFNLKYLAVGDCLGELSRWLGSHVGLYYWCHDEHWRLPDQHWRFKGWQGCWEGLFCRLGRLAGLASRMGWWALWASWPVTVGWRADVEFWFWRGKMQVDIGYKYHHSVFALSSLRFCIFGWFRLCFLGLQFFPESY